MQIPIRKSFFILLSFLCILLLMHLFVHHISWAIHNIGMFNLDTEANIPTWYSTILLFLVSLCSLIVYRIRVNGITRSERGNAFWLFLAIVYCFLSMDEAARIHEFIHGYTCIKWFYTYAPFGALIFIITAVYFSVIRSNYKDLRIWILGGLICYASGGLVAEFLSHYFSPLSPVLQQVEFMFEEGMEMFGTSMVLMGCFTELNHLNAQT